MGEYYAGICGDCYCFRELRGGQGQEGICTIDPPQVTVVLRDPTKPELGHVWISKQAITLKGSTCSRGFRVQMGETYEGRCDDCHFFREVSPSGQEGNCILDPPQVVVFLKDVKKPELGYIWISRQPTTMRLWTCSRGRIRGTVGRTKE